MKKHEMTAEQPISRLSQASRRQSKPSQSEAGRFVNTNGASQVEEKAVLTRVVLGLCVVAVMGASGLVAAEIRNVPSQYSTIQEAFDESVAGDNIVVANGTYTNTGNTYLWLRNRGGAAGSPITIQAENSGGAVLDGLNQQGANGVSDVIYVDSTSSNIVIAGFEINNGYKGGIKIYGSYIQVIGCNIHHNGGVFNGAGGQNGIYSGPATTGNAYIANYIHNNGRISLNSDLDHGLYLEGDNAVVMSNLIIANCEYGIQVSGSATVSNMKIYNNTIANNRNGSGIQLWQTMDGIDIANNIIYGNGLDPGSQSATAYGIRTFNCHGSGVQIRNNLFYANRDGEWDMDNGTVSFTESGSITTSNPLFVNSASDWHLQKCSAAIDCGLTLSIVTYDFDGLPRPIGTAYDMGAYER